MPGLMFNDVSGSQGLLQAVEDDLNFAPGQISGNSVMLAQFTRRINKWYQKVVTMIFASRDDWDWDDTNATDYPVATTNLVANQQDYGIPLSLNVLKIERVEISFDGTTYFRANPIDIKSINHAVTGTVALNDFSTNAPCYEIRANSFWVYPTPIANATAGIKIWFLRGPLEFTIADTTKQPGIDAPFHGMIATGASFDFAKIKNLPSAPALQAELQDYETRLKQYYGLKDEDKRWQFGALLPDYDDSVYGQPGSYN